MMQLCTCYFHFLLMSSISYQNLLTENNKGLGSTRVIKTKRTWQSSCSIPVTRGRPFPCKICKWQSVQFLFCTEEKSRKFSSLELDSAQQNVLLQKENTTTHFYFAKENGIFLVCFAKPFNFQKACTAGNRKRKVICNITMYTMWPRKKIMLMFIHLRYIYTCYVLLYLLLLFLFQSIKLLN